MPEFVGAPARFFRTSVSSTTRPPAGVYPSGPSEKHEDSGSIIALPATGSANKQFCDTTHVAEMCGKHFLCYNTCCRRVWCGGQMNPLVAAAIFPERRSFRCPRCVTCCLLPLFAPAGLWSGERDTSGGHGRSHLRHGVRDEQVQIRCRTSEPQTFFLLWFKSNVSVQKTTHACYGSIRIPVHPHCVLTQDGLSGPSGASY